MSGLYSGAMDRRCVLFALAVLGAAPARAEDPPVLALYGLPLKDATVEAFAAAAKAVGAETLQPGVFDVRAAGVPALERLTVTAHEGRVAQAQFLVKAYGQDNLALRELLLDKYGPPLTVSARPLPFGGFGGRSSPRGGFQWLFADGMRLVYQHPTIGDVTLSYVDDARLKAVETPAPPADLKNRF